MGGGGGGGGSSPLKTPNFPPKKKERKKKRGKGERERERERVVHGGGRGACKFLRRIASIVSYFMTQLFKSTR